MVGQHGHAARIGLDRHAALAAGGIGAHQRPPGALMGAVDGQQLLRRRDHRFGLGLVAQQRLGEAARPVAQPLALAGQPGVEARVDPVEILEQFAIEQRQRGRPHGGGAQHLLHVHPHRAGAQRQMVAVDGDDVRADRVQRFHQAVDLLAQRGARLLLRPPAPQHLGELAAQHRARRGQRQDGQQRAGLAPGWQDALAGQRPGFHLPDQPQPHLHRRRPRRLLRRRLPLACPDDHRRVIADGCCGSKSLHRASDIFLQLIRFGSGLTSVWQQNASNFSPGD